MHLGYIGLGKMGEGMVELLLEKGHQVTVFDVNSEAMTRVASSGAGPAETPAVLVRHLSPPRLIWIMVPYQAVDTALRDILPHLTPGDTVIDGGNSPYRESMRRGKELAAKGVDFLDAGVSGGPGGARNGACIMVGGTRQVFAKFEGLFRDLAVDGGYRHVGASGAGHFVKMVHNGIEYGMMQALAEGFAVMQASAFDLDLVQVADVYNRGSVIESRLVGWLKRAYEQHGRDLADVTGAVSHSGEGMWTVEAGKELGIAVRVIADALEFRIASQKSPSYTGRIVSALRNQFGGHPVKVQT
jgi:6-phosphogluconate dehydrogenase